MASQTLNEQIAELETEISAYKTMLLNQSGFRKRKFNKSPRIFRDDKKQI